MPYTVPGDLSTQFGLIDWKNKDLQREDTVLYKILIETDKTKTKDVIKGLEDLRSQYPEIKWTTLQEALAESNLVLKQRYAFLIIAIIVLIFVGVFGTIITLNSFIQTKRMEYAVLRAISVTPRQLFKIVLSQSLLFSIVGVLVGVVAGTIMSIALSVGVREMVIPNWKVILYMIVIIFSFALFFTLPIAIRISRKSVTEELLTVSK